MKPLNNKSIRIFLKLIKKLNQKSYIKIENQPYMSLSLELLHEVQTSIGAGKLYSLSHSFVQNGDLMRDPEMCFIVVADTQNKTFVFPQLYRLDSMGVYEESVHIVNGSVTHCLPTWQAGHCAFANQWMQNIIKQGFLK